MEEVKLDVQIRSEVGSRNVQRVRRQDCVPGIVYGGKKKTASVKMNRRAFERIRRQHHGEVVFHINIMEGDKKLEDYSAIVKEEQHDPVTDEVLHVDFKRISLKEEIEVKAPIVAKGEAIGVKRDGGSVDQILWELNVICLPMDMPEEIVVDVNALEIGDSIYVKDIVLPASVKTKQDLEAIVLSVIPPRKEEEEIPVEVEEGMEPELIKEKKEEEEEEVAEAPEAKPQEDSGKKEE